MLFSTPPLGDDGFQPLADGETCDEDNLTFNDFPTLGAFTAEQKNLLNGVDIPRLITAPDQVERWRILHAGFLDEVFLGVFRGTDNDCTGFSTAEADTLKLVQIGRDGLILPQTFESSYLFMSPGYRIEAMLGGEGNLTDGETWCLVAARFLDGANPTLGEFGSQPMAPQTPPSPSDIFTRFGSDGRLVAILNVTASAGPATETALPEASAIAALAPSLELDGVDIADRCAEAATTPDTTTVDQVAMLQVGFWTVDDPDPCGCDAYNVNCGNFESIDRSVYPFDRDLPLNAIEHWRVAASVDGHPFHIHINPFIVCPNDNVFDPLPFPHWRDTYLVNFTRKLDLISQNRAFTGPYVFHCHKLTHEDHGMMELIRVCDPATDPTCGDYDWRSCAEGDLECAKSLAATDCALNAVGPIDLAACVTQLSSPLGVCGPNACGEGVPCDGGQECIDHVCQNTCDEDTDCDPADACSSLGLCLPAPCFPPCGPGDTCVHGVCE
jgi:FtsP/CotA-like multicopper oxidase with cupredoxin domain